MILAVDVGGDRRAYGFELVLNSVRKRYGDIVRYVSNADLGQVEASSCRVLLLSYMFTTNLLHTASVFRKLGLLLWAKERVRPIVIAGGPPVSENPEPIAPFIDIGVIGEGEWAILDILDILFASRCDKSALAEVYERVDCAYVPRFYAPAYDADERTTSHGGRVVSIRREDPTRAYDIGGLYTRKQRHNEYLEYSIEWHRGCKRRCMFCSYTHLQAPYREVDHAVFHERLAAIARRDPAPRSKVVAIQTNLFHLDLDTVRLLKLYDKLPPYSSACYVDMFSRRGRELLSFVRAAGNMYLRFGIEDFTEAGRARLGKPVPDRMLAMLPALFPGHGRTVKLFFISHLPWQEAAHVDALEDVFGRMADKATYYYTIDMFVTILSSKPSTPMVLYPKRYKPDLTRRIRRIRYRRGKLTVKVRKNQSEDAFYEVNVLALANRRLASALAQLATGVVSRKRFLTLANQAVNINALMQSCSDSALLPNGFIDYTAPSRWRGGKR